MLEPVSRWTFVLPLLGFGFACLLLPCAASPQAPPGASPITAGEDLPVSLGAAAGFAAVEPHLAADPGNAGHLVAGVILVANLGDPRQPENPPDERLLCAALASFDAGRTWVRHDFPLKEECLDPWVAILPDGSAVFAGLAPELVVFRSADGGRTWNDRPVSLGSGFDHPSLAVDRTAGPYAGNLYAVAHQGQPGSRAAMRSSSPAPRTEAPRSTSRRGSSRRTSRLSRSIRPSFRMGCWWCPSSTSPAPKWTDSTIFSSARRAG